MIVAVDSYRMLHVDYGTSFLSNFFPPFSASLPSFQFSHSYHITDRNRRFPSPLAVRRVVSPGAKAKPTSGGRPTTTAAAAIASLVVTTTATASSGRSIGS
jgi:hypothetical protein